MTYELTPKERVGILSKRLLNLRKGSGDYSRSARYEEIAKTKDALQEAFVDHGLDCK